MNNDPPLKGWPRLKSLVEELMARKAEELVRLVKREVPAAQGIVATPGLTGAEVGVSRGWTSEHLLQAFPTLHLTMVDCWENMRASDVYVGSGDGHARLKAQEQQEHRWAAEQRTLFAKDRRTVLAMDSDQASYEITVGSLDFALIDSDHTYQGVMRDLLAYFSRVRIGGLIVLHDIDHPRDKRGLWGVRRAAEEFCQRYDLTLNADSPETIGWFWVSGQRGMAEILDKAESLDEL